MAATTSATPSSSDRDGICARTTTPITVAVAGSSETISEYVARLSRAIASWSKTYGTTDDATPTPSPAASATGSTNAGAALGAADRRDRDERDEHRRTEPVDPVQRRVPRHAVREDDVEREQPGVREREGDADAARRRAARR